ncbi:MAG TPA: SCE4755 family polysaccharide monooxygenase-like protein [Polyangiaceae bacterium]|nr:SCE4755 family polysaccharide monooxygenase-like protein [Polyangiaceae bacterium]
MALESPRGVLSAALLVATFLASPPASAHLALTYPPSRYGKDVLKAGPCGKTGGTRSANVTVLRPGAVLTVEWDEYVNHPGHFRISFDDDGDDAFQNPVCKSGCTTTSPVFEFGGDPSILKDDIPDTPQGGVSQVDVTLPDIECDNCTLQAIQVMYDKPPYVAPGNDIYYQCADLVLSRTLPLSDGGVEAASSASTDPGGCSVSVGRSAGKMPLVLSAVAALLARRRRRSRR